MIELERCPFAVPEPVHWRICEYAALLEVGILPVAGGLEDQSESFLEALRFTQGLKQELEKAEQEQAAKMREGSRRGG